MFERDISIKSKLPDISEWLSPKYNGPYGVGTNSNWAVDFPEYSEQYPKMMAIKRALNTVKQKIDPIYASKSRSKTYTQITDIVRLHDTLRGSSGLIAQEYGAEVVTNAWLKMFELCAYLRPHLDAISKKRIKKFNSFHLAEAPGNFILAINHFISTNYKSVDWNWLASTYVDLYAGEKNPKYFGDYYGLMEKYPENWYYGSDCDGDITSVNNILSFRNRVKRLGELHLITSDVKYCPAGEHNFDEEERINLPVHLGHLLCTLACLSKGGIAILKQFTLFENPSIAMMWILNHAFKQVKIVKPVTSRPANSEIYIVCIDYRQNITEPQFEKLYQIMRYIQFLNTERGSPAIFKNIDSKFALKILEVTDILARQQIRSINRNLQLFTKYEHVNFGIIAEDMRADREEHAREWIHLNQIKKINIADRLIR